MILLLHTLVTRTSPLAPRRGPENEDDESTTRAWPKISRYILSQSGEELRLKNEWLNLPIEKSNNAIG